MHHHLRIVPPRGIITPALNKGGKTAPARLLITKLELYPHKPRQILTLTCNLIFLLELFPSNPRTFARPRDIITHALAHKWGNAVPPPASMATHPQLSAHAPTLERGNIRRINFCPTPNHPATIRIVSAQFPQTSYTRL